MWASSLAEDIHSAAGVGVRCAGATSTPPHVLLRCNVVGVTWSASAASRCDRLRGRYDRIRHPLHCVRELLDDLPEMYDRNGK